MTILLYILYWLYFDTIEHHLVEYRNDNACFILQLRFTLFNNAGLLILEQLVALESFMFPFLMKNEYPWTFAAVDRNVTGAPGCPLAVTWISTREQMTRGQSRERGETEIMETSS